MEIQARFPQFSFRLCQNEATSAPELPKS